MKTVVYKIICMLCFLSAMKMGWMWGVSKIFIPSVEWSANQSSLLSELEDIWEVERINNSKPCSLVPGSFCRSEEDGNEIQ